MEVGTAGQMTQLSLTLSMFRQMRDPMGDHMA